MQNEKSFVGTNDFPLERNIFRLLNKVLPRFYLTSKSSFFNVKVLYLLRQSWDKR